MPNESNMSAATRASAERRLRELGRTYPDAAVYAVNDRGTQFVPIPAHLQSNFAWVLSADSPIELMAVPFRQNGVDLFTRCRHDGAASGPVRLADEPDSTVELHLFDFGSYVIGVVVDPSAAVDISRGASVAPPPVTDPLDSTAPHHPGPPPPAQPVPAAAPASPSVAPAPRLAPPPKPPGRPSSAPAVDASTVDEEDAAEPRLLAADIYPEGDPARAEMQAYLDSEPVVPVDVVPPQAWEPEVSTATPADMDFTRSDLVSFEDPTSTAPVDVVPADQAVPPAVSAGAAAVAGSVAAAPVVDAFAPVDVPPPQEFATGSIPQVMGLKVTADRRIVAVDNATATGLGWTPEDMLGQTIDAFIDADDVVDGAASWREVVGVPGAVREITNRWMLGSGEWIWAEQVDTNRLEDPTFGAMSVELRDVTNRILVGADDEHEDEDGSAIPAAAFAVAVAAPAPEDATEAAPAPDAPLVAESEPSVAPASTATSIDAGRDEAYQRAITRSTTGYIEVDGDGKRLAGNADWFGETGLPEGSTLGDFRNAMSQRSEFQELVEGALEGRRGGAMQAKLPFGRRVDVGVYALTGPAGQPSVLVTADHVTGASARVNDDQASMISAPVAPSRMTPPPLKHPEPAGRDDVTLPPAAPPQPAPSTVQPAPPAPGTQPVAADPATHRRLTQRDPNADGGPEELPVPEDSKRRFGMGSLLGLLVAVASAAFMRLWRLADVPAGLHGPEAVAGLEADRILNEGWIGVHSPAGLGAPAAPYYAQAVGVGLFENSIFGVRIIPALIGILTVAVLWFVARRHFGAGVAFASAIALAFTNLHLHFSRTGFNDVWWPLLGLLAVSSLAAALERGSVWRFIVAGLWAAAGVYFTQFHWLFMVVLAVAVLLWLIWRSPRRSSSGVMNALVYGATMIAASVPMLLIVLDRDELTFFPTGLRSTPEWQFGSILDRIGQFFRWYAGSWDTLLFDPVSTPPEGVYASPGFWRFDGTGIQSSLGVVILLGAVVGAILLLVRAIRDRSSFAWLIAAVLIGAPIGQALANDLQVSHLSVLTPFIAILFGLTVGSLLDFLNDTVGGWAAAAIGGLVLLVVGATSIMGYFDDTVIEDAVGWASQNDPYNPDNFESDPDHLWQFQSDLAGGLGVVKDLRSDDGELPYVNLLSEKYDLDYEAVAYLLPDLDGGDDTLDLGPDLSRDQVFVVLGADMPAQLAEVQQRYPGGLVTSIDEGDQPWAVYRIAGR